MNRWLPLALRSRTAGRADFRLVQLEDRTNPAAVVFLDPAVADFAALAAAPAPDTAVVVLDPHADGVRQIGDALRTRTGLDAVAVVAHGAAGRVALGSAALSSATLPGYAADLAAVRAALRPGGDLLLYSCDVAAGPGAGFVRALAAATGADVAASTRPVGAAARGGSWGLDVATGPVAAGLPFAPAAVAAYAHVLPAFTVVRGQSATFPNPDGFFAYNITELPAHGSLVVAAQNSKILTGFVYTHDGSAGNADPFTLQRADGGLTYPRYDVNFVEAGEPPSLVVNAINYANTLSSDDTITFATQQFGAAATIQLTRPLPDIVAGRGKLTIQGPARSPSAAGTSASGSAAS